MINWTRDEDDLLATSSSIVFHQHNQSVQQQAYSGL